MQEGAAGQCHTLFHGADDHCQAVPKPRRAPRRPAWSTAHVCLSKPNTVTKEQKLHETQSPFQAIILVKFRTGSEEEDNRVS